MNSGVSPGNVAIAGAVILAEAKAYTDTELAARNPVSVSGTPGPADDSTLGFFVGAQWINTGVTPNAIYYCVSAAVGNALWNLLGAVALTALPAGFLEDVFPYLESMSALNIASPAAVENPVWS